jgi:glycosyltransferase involved in cell wall biosynthesis
MRILYASERPPYPFFLGGAARCAHQLLHGIADGLGVSCAAVGASDYAVTGWGFPRPEEYSVLGVRSSAPSADPSGRPIPRGKGIRGLDCGYPVYVLPDFWETLGGFIDWFRPGIVWAQLEGGRQVLEIAQRKGVRTLFFVHDAESDPAELRAVAALGGHVVTSSRFLADKVRRVIGRPVQVIYPPAERYFDVDGDLRGYLTMINPHRVKGVDTFLELARRLPDQPFLLLESWKLSDAALDDLIMKLADLPNVRFERRVSDMRAIYRQTRLLLVPSRWEEGFGMVAIEAQSCGIPVIASARGGLPESVGDGGLLIQDYLNVDAWVAAVSRVLCDAAVYDDLAQRARRHAADEQFSAAFLARRLLAICESEAEGRGRMARGLQAVRSQLERLPGLGRWFQ